MVITLPLKTLCLVTVDDYYLVTCASSVNATPDTRVVSYWFGCSTLTTDSNNVKSNICKTSELKCPKMMRPTFLLSSVLYYIIPSVSNNVK